MRNQKITDGDSGTHDSFGAIIEKEKKAVILNNQAQLFQNLTILSSFSSHHSYNTSALQK